MVARGLVVLTILTSSCVLSLPVTPSQLENDDVKVMKCIVEALADVLSRPRPRIPVSPDCLVTLQTDDRLVSVLRHRSFLKVLQDIAVEGREERAQRQKDDAAPERTTQVSADDDADRSMLEAFGDPGERSVPSQKRRKGKGDGERGEEDSAGTGESREDDEEVKEKRERGESPGSQESASVDEWSEAEKREEEEYGEERATSKEDRMIKDKKGARSGEKKRAARTKSREKKSVEEDEEGEEEEKDKRYPKEEADEKDEGEAKRGSEESSKRVNKRGKSAAVKKRKKAAGKEAQHSEEEEEEEEEKKKRFMGRSPEEKELRMIARGRPKERKRWSEEEEGSGSPKAEEPEIERLATIESELENVAQKLRGMRRGRGRAG
ncbi:chromogranin-A isoform X3 [Pseudoliparis swirei]|uniref:chromogranin-A isoform X3 n=1 Tax=Pseudoliparis swirei TaxID=2059687 RepID=UPI0024BEAB1A|nr:chromogranin-A isoform X3 [Pseudoliparis swirei]XP_056283614.1 chromogranin-A isoform X3 [Pseudoliparis swirei]